MKKHLSKDSGYWQKVLVRFFIVVSTIAVIVWVMPRNNDTNFKVERGKPWRYADFTAPFDFPIYKSDELVKRERDSLRKAFEPYYNYDKTAGARQAQQFRKDYADGIPGVPAECVTIVANRLLELYGRGIMNTSEYNLLRVDTTKMVRVVSGKNAVSSEVRKLYSAVGAYEQLFQRSA